MIPHDSPAVTNYITVLQAVINRMASNSTSCKNWCITVVSAIVVIIISSNKPHYIFISLMPIILFFFLDSYYLGLERCFRSLYSSFVKKIHSQGITINDLYVMQSHLDIPSSMKETIKATTSFSIFPFYGLMVVMLIVVRLFSK
jgi:hypothetical protein